MGFFPNFALVEFRTSEICVSRGLSVVVKLRGKGKGENLQGALYETKRE